MSRRNLIISLAAVTVLTAGTVAPADTVQLVNGDRLNGKVASLDEKQLVFRSASFGELKIDRAKIDLIALGDKGLPDLKQSAASRLPSTSAASGGVVGQVAPLLQSPAVQRQVGPMLEQLLGAGGVGEMQQNIDNARRGLQDLKKDFGDSPDSKALDAYINMFNLLSPPSATSRQPKPPAVPPQPHPPVKAPETDKSKNP